MRATSMAIFSKMLFGKSLDHSYVKVSSQQGTRHIDNSILEDTLWLKILWTWIKICANSFIKTLENIMKRKSRKAPWKLSPAKKKRSRTSKNIALKWMIFQLLLYVSFSLKQIQFLNLTQYLLTYNSFCHSLFTFLPLDFYLYSTDFEVHPMPLRLFNKNQ